MTSFTISLQEKNVTDEELKSTLFSVATNKNAEFDDVSFIAAKNNFSSRLK